MIFEALAADEIDVYVDYSGTLWANRPIAPISGREQALLDALRAELAKQNIVLPAPSASRTPMPW